MTAESTGDEGTAAGPAERVAFDLGESGDAGSVSLDVVFDVLSNSRRRLILARLFEVGGESTTGDLAEYIAAVENDKPQSELTSQERKRVYVGIYQTHLPKMDDAGVVEVDDRGAVSLGPNADAVYQFLESDDDGDDSPWPVYYGAHTALSGVALLVAWLFFASAVAPLFAVSLAVFAALAGVHAKSRRDDSE